ncbi:MAG: hypothetical protein GY835_15240 [bacterium]|nr:hypothetical protein [bacterium]
MMDSENVDRRSDVHHADDFDVQAFIRSVWRRRLAVVAITGVVTLAALIYSLLLTPVFTAHVTILPQIRTDGSAALFGQVMGMTGLNLGGASASHEELYARILTSDRILDAAIARRWQDGDGEVSLYDAFDIETDSKEQTGAVSSYRLKGILRTDVISFSRDKLTGYMELRVSVPRDPSLAAELANYLIAQLEEYNQSFKRTKAAEQREFIADRLVEVKADLDLQEERRTGFIKTNRSYSTSPDLLQEYNRLSREVQATTSVWVELRKQLEIAKIDENKELISLDILDPATIPVKRSSPNRKKLTLIGLILGAALSVVWVVAREQVGTGT